MVHGEGKKSSTAVAFRTTHQYTAQRGTIQRPSASDHVVLRNTQSDRRQMDMRGTTVARDPDVVLTVHQPLSDLFYDCTTIVGTVLRSSHGTMRGPGSSITVVGSVQRLYGQDDDGGTTYST